MDHGPKHKMQNYKITKFLEDNIGENPDDLEYGNDFLDMTTKT